MSRDSVTPRVAKLVELSDLTGRPMSGDFARVGAGIDVIEQELKKRLEGLRSEHRDLDAAIHALSEAGATSGSVDQLQIARLKKRKLRIRDQIAIVEDNLIPDIIA